jgi:UDP-N-acetylmuramoyl-tripeptide--D-alanyl-D-alanine ligase
MIRMRVSEAASALEASYRGEDVMFTGCSTDTRTLAVEQLFVALRGPSHDGHDYLHEAGSRGAAAALVSARVDAALPIIEVSDTLEALGKLAGAWRDRFELPVVAVTGSNGKTTVKEMLAAILGAGAPVLATRGNLNNEIGLPLTLLRLDASHRMAVLELGANHPGEIAYLARLARPRVGVITQCAPAHLEGFGSIEGVARAKGELLSHLDQDGTAVINADDPFAPLWRSLAGTRKSLTFALDTPADVCARGRQEGMGCVVEMTTPRGPIRARLALPGRHNIANAAAATAAALAMDAYPDAIVAGLQSVRPVPGRLEPKRTPAGVCLIDDTYNANPQSLAAALQVLDGFAGRHWLVLGDMAELGGDAPELHREAGLAARDGGVERLYAVGELVRESVASFGEGARHFPSREALVSALEASLDADVTVLVKGSRSMEMERVVTALGAE